MTFKPAHSLIMILIHELLLIGLDRALSDLEQGLMHQLTPARRSILPFLGGNLVYSAEHARC